MGSQSRAITVLVTRPEPQASRFGLALQDRFGGSVVPVISPLLHEVPLSQDLPKGVFSAIILTSETGARQAGRLKREGVHIPEVAYCVGNRTAQVAQQQGFSAISADGAAEDLIRLIVASNQPGPFLHLRGRESRGEVVSSLMNAGIAADEAVVYAQEPVPLTLQAQQAIQRDDNVAIPLFSPRTAALFSQGVRNLVPAKPLIVIALSPAVLKAVVGLDGALLHLAEAPTQMAMLTKMSQVLFNA